MKLNKIMKYILTIIVIILALGYAGKSDHKDAVISEMKNNGSYYELSSEHPEASEDSLVKMYLGK